MKSAQKGSLHRQFYHSLHRQRGAGVIIIPPVFGRPQIQRIWTRNSALEDVDFETETDPTTFMTDEAFDGSSTRILYNQYAGEVKPGGDPLYIIGGDTPPDPAGGADGRDPTGALFTYIGIYSLRFNLGGVSTTEYEGSKMYFRGPLVGTLAHYKARPSPSNPATDLYSDGPLDLIEASALDLKAGEETYHVLLPPGDYTPVHPYPPATRVRISVFFPGVSAGFLPDPWYSSIMNPEDPFFPIIDRCFPVRLPTHDPTLP